MPHLQTVTPDTLELLRALSSKPEIQGLRLVGGTALALQYGHRQSVDLDFFGIPAVAQEDIIDLFNSLGQTMVRTRTERILQVVLNGVMVDVVDYSRYPWIDAHIEDMGLTLASPRDIAAMKINAVEGRGTKKDFIDIYQLLQHYTLAEILDFYAHKYPNHSIFRALLSLTYFDDAEQQAMPVMFDTTPWEKMKQTIIAATKDFKIDRN